MINKVLKGVRNPSRIILRIWVLCSKIISSDKLFLRVYYFLAVGEKLNLNNPELFTEKIQWLKLNNRSNLCTQMVDKYDVRKIIRERIGDEYLIPLYGVWDKFNDINFNELPDRFVLKTTHDSGTVIVCKDKKELDIEKARKKINKSLKRNYFWKGREYPYKNVKPKIIAEELMCNKDGSDLADYKFFCFDGEPKILFYASDRFNEKKEPAKFDYYDMELHHLPIKSKGHKNSGVILNNIVNFDLMKDLAKQLSSGFPHLRVDLYLINSRIYFGELTFHHDGGIVPFIPKEWDKILGEMIKLPL